MMSYSAKGRYWAQLHHIHAYLKGNVGSIEKGWFSKQLSLLCMKSADDPEKGCYWEQHYHLYGIVIPVGVVDRPIVDAELL